MTGMWGRLEEEPVFVFTGDQDWAPDWAMAEALQLAVDLKVPMHVFATGPTSHLHEPAAGVTVGIHPNFMAGSTHGSTDVDVIEHCVGLYPQADTFRSHCFSENTPALWALAERGFVADSNACLHLQPGITPAMHASGMVRLPVWLEDDVALRWDGGTPSLEDLLPTLLTPGLKILNFHPGLVAMNTPDLATYEKSRASLYGDAPRPAHVGRRGVRDLLVELVARVQDEGLGFEPFPAVADEARARVETAFPEGLAGWRPASRRPS